MNTLSAIFGDAAPILGGLLVISVLNVIILVGWGWSLPWELS